MSFFNVGRASNSFINPIENGYASDNSSEDEDVDELYARFTNECKQALDVSKRSKKIEIGNLLPDDQFETKERTPDIPDLSKNENPISDINPLAHSLSQAVMKSPEEEQRLALEYEKGSRDAKQQLLKIGIGIVGCGALRILAHYMKATAMPYIVAQAINPILNIFITGAQLVTNKYAWSTIKNMAKSVCSTIGSFLFKNKKPVTFGGGVQSTETGNHKESEVKQLLTVYYEALSKFSEEAETATEPSAQLDVTEKLQRSIIEASTNFILANGTEKEKRRITALQNFQNNYEAYVNGIPAQAKRYKDLPLTTQNQLRQLIQDTLTSQVPELIDWGKRQAHAIGMSPQAIERVIHSTELAPVKSR